MNFPAIWTKQSCMPYWGGMRQYLGRLQPISPKPKRFQPKSKILRPWSTVCSMRIEPKFQIRSKFGETWEPQKAPETLEALDHISFFRPEEYPSKESKETMQAAMRAVFQDQWVY